MAILQCGRHRIDIPSQPIWKHYISALPHNYSTQTVAAPRRTNKSHLLNSWDGKVLTRLLCTCWFFFFSFLMIRSTISVEGVVLSTDVPVIQTVAYKEIKA